jgi:hypothetical protein
MSKKKKDSLDAKMVKCTSMMLRYERPLGASIVW